MRFYYAMRRNYMWPGAVDGRWGLIRTRAFRAAMMEWLLYGGGGSG
ncbi:MAG TPA: hypothetical protein VJX92_19285 [Methylomirabilota bacterium]|nr:hypothetical protein [Methylomirabilota bacterium]